MKVESIFLGEEKRTEKEKEENIWRRKISFFGRRRKRREVLEKGNIFFVEEKENIFLAVKKI